MQDDSVSFVQEESSTQCYISSVIVTSVQVTPLASFPGKKKKREFEDAMDTEEEDTAKTPKEKNIEK